MQPKGFFSSLFDYSFSSYITPRMIKVLYVIATVLIALWTLVIILLAFRASSTLGILALLIFGPIYFLLAMIWTRVALELVSAFFRIHEDVRDLNQRAGGNEVAPAVAPLDPAPVESPPAVDPAPVASPPAVDPAPVVSTPVVEPAAAVPVARFCENCGTERSPGKRFCTGCGAALA